jgi:DNA-binding CsgD family transcriptional regulator
MTDPWNLSLREHRSLDELISHGCNKTAAKHMGVSVRTLELYLYKAYRKMDVVNRLQAVLAYDRWRQGRSKPELARLEPSMSLVETHRRYIG